MAKKKVEAKPEVQNEVTIESQEFETQEFKAEPGAVLVREFDVQLDIHNHKVVSVNHNSRVVVESMFGDIYVDVEKVDFLPKFKCSPGEQKSFSNVSALCLISASRSIVKISEYQ